MQQPKQHADYFPDPLSEEIWATTYKDYSDNCVQDQWRRNARGIASVEKTPELRKVWEDIFYDFVEDYKNVPGGRISANAGSEWTGTTQINCFVGGLPDYDLDSLEGIYKVLLEQAQTLKSEGGWGMDFSWIRPRGTLIQGVGVESPGAIKFMELFDKSSEIVTSGSGVKSTNAKSKKKIRKGAMMSTMNCFDKSTKVLTNKGYLSLEVICDAQDPSLMAITEDGEEYPIEDWIINPPALLYEVESECGYKVLVTGDHKFQVYNTLTEKEYLKPLLKINPEVELLVRLE